MKRLVCLLFLITLLICGCAVNSDDSTTPSDFTPIDYSYEHIAELPDFKCYVSYQDTIITIENDQAKALYKLVFRSTKESGHAPTNHERDYVFLVFYSGAEITLNENGTQYYGNYTIYEDGWLTFSGSPYHSASFDYKAETDLFDTVIATALTS